MDLERRFPFPVGIAFGTAAGALIGTALAVMLLNFRRRRGHQNAGASPGFFDFARFAFAAWALIRLANELLMNDNKQA